MSTMHEMGGFNLAPRVFRIRGMDIRLHLLLILVVGFWLIEGFFFGRLPGLLRAAILTAALLGIVLWHELGHAWAARRSHLRVNGIMLWPLGGECQISGAMPSPRTEIFVAVMGPAAHALLVAAAFFPIFFLLPEMARFFDPMNAASALVGAWGLAFFILLFNLIPAFPLDGGRVLRALLTFKLGEVRATVIAARTGQVFAVLYFLLGLVVRQPFLVLIGVYVFFGAAQELRAAMLTGRVYEPSSRNPYAASLNIKEDWSREAVEGYGRPEKAGFFQRLRTRRRLRKLARETEKREKIKAEVDRILEKVSREGMPSLTAAERRILKQGSSEYRRKRD